MRRRIDACRGDDGMTMLELLVAMIVFGVLVGIAVGPYTTYRRRQQHIGSTRELVAFLRRAQVRAIAEETTYRVDLTATGAQAYRLASGDACGTPTAPVWSTDQQLTPSNGRITYTGASFLQSCTGSTGASVWFYARGTGSKGSVTVSENGTSKVYTVKVEGLTARVSYA